MSRRTIKRGAGRRWVEGKSLRLADQVRSLQDKAFDHDSRVVSFGRLLLFSSNAGDAWLLDGGDQLAARLARDRDPESTPWGRPMPASLSGGRAVTASTGLLLSTRIASPAA